jgi:hypothetical protein
MVKRIAQFAVVGLSLAISPCLVNAQRGVGAPAAFAAAPRAMGMPVVAPAMHAAPAAAQAAARGSGHVGSSVGGHPVAPRHPSRPAAPRPSGQNYPGSSYGVGVYGSGYVPNGSFGSGGGYPTPGLGFDYAHFAAVHPGAFRHRGFGGGGIVPFIGGGIYVPFPYYEEGAPPAEQPEEAAAQQDQAQQPDQQDYPSHGPAPVHERTAASAPSAPSPEFIFVRRDGTVFFAVAYSWINGSLQYITQDGLRRVIPVNTLDLDATSQFNEQRGLSVRSPA